MHHKWKIKQCRIVILNQWNASKIRQRYTIDRTNIKGHNNMMCCFTTFMLVQYYTKQLKGCIYTCIHVSHIYIYIDTSFSVDFSTYLYSILGHEATWQVTTLIRFNPGYNVWLLPHRYANWHVVSSYQHSIKCDSEHHCECMLGFDEHALM